MSRRCGENPFGRFNLQQHRAQRLVSLDVFVVRYIVRKVQKLLQSRLVE